MSWKELPPVAKFSLIAFVVAIILGLMSMGVQGYGVYFAVEFALPVSIESISGDSLWPSTILAGMAWAIGFLIAGFATARLKNKLLVYFVYLLILWIWAYLVWWAIIGLKVVQ